MRRYLKKRFNQEMEIAMFDGPLQEMMKQAQKVADQMVFRRFQGFSDELALIRNFLRNGRVRG